MQVLSHTPLAERRFKDQDRQPVADRILDRILEKKKARKALAVSAAQGGAAAEVAVPAKAVEVVEVSSSAAAVVVPAMAVEVVEGSACKVESMR